MTVTESLYEALKTMGEHDPHNLACVLVADAYWNLVGPTAAFGRRDRLDADRVLSWYRAHAGELRQATRDGRYVALLSDGRLPASAAGPVLANIRRVAPDACDRFLGLLADPATPVRRRVGRGFGPVGRARLHPFQRGPARQMLELDRTRRIAAAPLLGFRPADRRIHTREGM